MVWLLIIAIVGLVFAPVMWLKPSPAQRRMGRLRTAARQADVTVRFESPPLHGVRGTMAAYRWAYSQRHPGPDFVLVRDEAASASLKPLREGWRWRVEPLRPLPVEALARLEDALAGLPGDALVLESGSLALTLWWEETVAIEALSPLLARLTALRDALSGRPDRPGGNRPSGQADTPSMPR
ncbi:preprotein translocase subunit YajC [Halomonas saccharevitans]|uniref:Preprotein translocase subunit YajC n=1 Tax=Halomonas saccharevitans TaxID=416872 RepID=A0ABU3NHU4_9GAMM|nr:preprotein translocase subunit YajC [Halomonas saccharevitans]MDT8880741.1 preprotein translocase subunit YajC [Halomonas saccharevitans]